MGCSGVVGILARTLLGQTLLALAETLAVGGAASAAVMCKARTPLEFAGMAAALRIRTIPSAASQPR